MAPFILRAETTDNEMQEAIYPSKISERVRVLAALFAAGMLSAILTIACVAWTGLSFLNPFVGAIFGAVVAICLSLLLWRWFFTGRIIAFICASIVAYWAAVWWVPIWGTDLLHWLHILHGNASLDKTSPGTFSFDGFIGAFIVLLAVLLLFSQETGWRIPAKAFFLSLAGAVLGLVSATAHKAVAGLAVAVLTRLGAPTDASLIAEHLYSAYLIWQTGMGLVIAVALLAPPAGTRLVLPLHATPFPARLTVWGKVFVILVVAETAVMAFIGGYDVYRSRTSQRQSENTWRQAPSAENLPRITPKPVEQMLILHEIAGYAPAEPQMKVEAARHEYRSNSGQPSRVISRTVAPRVTYRIQYKRPRASAPSSQPWVMATIWEFPNSEWANYELKDVPVTDAKTLSPSSIRSGTKFGNPVLTYTLKGVSGLYVYWTSTNRVVILHFPAGEEDEFIRQYLARYPSSLP